MSATVPAGPKISYRTCLGLNCTIASALPESGTYGSEPKTPCSRDTVNAPTATTITMTIGTHTRLTRRVILHSFPQALRVLRGRLTTNVKCQQLVSTVDRYVSSWRQSGNTLYRSP